VYKRQLIAGIELKGQDRIVAWHLESHLQQLEAQIAERLEEMALEEAHEPEPTAS
jgi:hypothetical protein